MGPATSSGSRRPARRRWSGASSPSRRPLPRPWRDGGCAATPPARFLHDCRRTAARNLIRAGVPERVAMLLTGHKSRAIFDRYNIIDEQELLTAGDQLARYLDQQAPAHTRRSHARVAAGIPGATRDVVAPRADRPCPGDRSSCGHPRTVRCPVPTGPASLEGAPRRRSRWDTSCQTRSMRSRGGLTRGGRRGPRRFARGPREVGQHIAHEPVDDGVPRIRSRAELLLALDIRPRNKLVSAVLHQGPRTFRRGFQVELQADHSPLLSNLFMHYVFDAWGARA